MGDPQAAKCISILYWMRRKERRRNHSFYTMNNICTINKQSITLIDTKPFPSAIVPVESIKRVFVWLVLLLVYVVPKDAENVNCLNFLTNDQSSPYFLKFLWNSQNNAFMSSPLLLVSDGFSETKMNCFHFQEMWEENSKETFSKPKTGSNFCQNEYD